VWKRLEQNSLATRALYKILARINLGDQLLVSLRAVIRHRWVVKEILHSQRGDRKIRVKKYHVQEEPVKQVTGYFFIGSIQICPNSQ
jgi:hypothetical protein